MTPKGKEYFRSTLELRRYILRVLDSQENYCRIQSYCRIFESYHVDNNHLLLTGGSLLHPPCFCQKY